LNSSWACAFSLENPTARKALAVAAKANFASPKNDNALRLVDLALTPNLWSAVGFLSDQFGQRENLSELGETPFHGGVDIASTCRSRVLASADGTVGTADRLSGYGNIVVIYYGLSIFPLSALSSGSV
jgi:murein DD-endopeptidase MepM/ murein hydrolase activator NlpD